MPGPFRAFFQSQALQATWSSAIVSTITLADIPPRKAPNWCISMSRWWMPTRPMPFWKTRSGPTRRWLNGFCRRN